MSVAENQNLEEIAQEIKKDYDRGDFLDAGIAFFELPPEIQQELRNNQNYGGLIERVLDDVMYGSYSGGNGSV